MKRHFIVIMLYGLTVLLSACEQNQLTPDADQWIMAGRSPAGEVAFKPVLKKTDLPDSDKAQKTFIEITWDDLVPEDYRVEVILNKYQKEIASFSDDDPEAIELYSKIQSELDNAPVNEKIRGKSVKLAGFVAPLEAVEGKVPEFLLVPYFGACIHVPPPPANQTILIKSKLEEALPINQIFQPVWVYGRILIEGQSTGLGEAGYKITNARVELYDR